MQKKNHNKSTKKEEIFFTYFLKINENILRKSDTKI